MKPTPTAPRASNVPGTTHQAHTATHKHACIHAGVNSRPALPELDALERLIEAAGEQLRTEVLENIDDGCNSYPIYALRLGNPDPAVPVLLLTAGIHGVERIGTQLLLAQLETLLARLRWDQGLQEDLCHLRLVLCPLLNPAGMARGSRANANGIDLMRNAPHNADEPGAWLLGGHRIGAWLPWYRGVLGDPMQAESAALCKLVSSEIAQAPLCLSLDCHSGFGMRDRLWFPYAGSSRPLEQLADMQALVTAYEGANPHHRYLFEPQCHQYRTHGDLWDHLYQQHLLRQATLPGQSAVFLPLTLELGSWLWVRKNLRQITSMCGLINPLVPHRHRRVLRHHNSLFDFMIRATRSWQAWRPDEATRNDLHQRALQRWYPGEHRT